jgi:L-threonylcarbamoyladenylate synthase
MQTRIFMAHNHLLSPHDARLAGDLIRDGRLVAFPTETVYGLGADATNDEAVKRIYAAKMRPHENPLIIHITRETSLTLPDDPSIRTLTDVFWPGPLTLIVPRDPRISLHATAGLETMCVRSSNHPIAIQLINAAQRPIAAPSANTSTRPSPTRASHVLSDLDGRIDAVIDGGRTDIGLESTIIDTTHIPFRIVRLGALSWEEINQFVPLAPVDPLPNTATPGGSHRHYAPRLRLIRVPVNQLSSTYHAHLTNHPAVITLTKLPDIPHGDQYITGDISSYARMLYDIFRDAESKGRTVLIVPIVEESGIGRTLNERTLRAME